jgi:hypothetical protein
MCHWIVVGGRRVLLREGPNVIGRAADSDAAHHATALAEPPAPEKPDSLIRVARLTSPGASGGVGSFADALGQCPA